MPVHDPRIHEILSNRKPKTWEERLADLQNCIDIQCSHGNWDYDPYMQGMANGMILAMNIMGDCKEEPQYMKAPEKWGKDTPSSGASPIEHNPESEMTQG